MNEATQNIEPGHCDTPESTLITVCIVQQPAAIFDLSESLRLANKYIAEAASLGAQVVVFPETWLTGYPAWVFGLAGWDDPEAKKWFSRLVKSSPVIGNDPSTGDIGPLLQAASDNEVTLVMGLNERKSHRSGTLYNSFIVVDADGSLLNVHRKLMPTHTERLVWAQGDGQGLRVVETTHGRLGGLICWEHWNPLARQALHAQQEELHVALWPDYPEIHNIASRAYAFEGRTFVLSAAQYLHTDNLPAEILEAYLAGVGPEAPQHGVLFDGGSSIIAPNGDCIAGPLLGEPGLLIAQIDTDDRLASMHDLDVTGHSARPDIFNLSIDRRSRPTIELQDTQDAKEDKR